MSLQPKLHPTPEEYLELERKTDYKSEYLNGEVYAMGGASPRHMLIVTNIAAELRNLFFYIFKSVALSLGLIVMETGRLPLVQCGLERNTRRNTRLKRIFENFISC